MFNDELFEEPNVNESEVCAVCQDRLYANNLAVKELCQNHHFIHLHCFNNMVALGNFTRCCLCNAALIQDDMH